MRRRTFMMVLGGSAVAWPLALRAQEAAKLPTIGFLGTESSKQFTDTFVQRLGELGWVEGRTLAIEYRWLEGDAAQAAAIAAEFVRLNVDIIVTTGLAAATVKQATSTIPIVFPAANDPVGDGLVASLARPGGNVTGLSNQATDLAGKRHALLHEVVPQLRRLAIMTNVGYPAALLEMGEVETTARTLGLDVAPLEVRQADDITSAYEALKARADALYVVGDSLLNSEATRITTFALGARLPAIYNNRSFVRAGGLLSYGPNFRDQFRHAAEIVDKILRGTKPGDIPVEQPTKFDLVVNLKAAKALGLEIPHDLLVLADDVFE